MDKDKIQDSVDTIKEEANKIEEEVEDTEPKEARTRGDPVVILS